MKGDDGNSKELIRMSSIKGEKIILVLQSFYRCKCNEGRLMARMGEGGGRKWSGRIFSGTNIKEEINEIPIFHSPYWESKGKKVLVPCNL
jgi:hypothetical protein